MPTNRDPFDVLTEAWEPRIRQAFIDAVRRITDRASITLLEDRLRKGDVEGAVRALGLDPSDFYGLRDAVVSAYGEGGKAFAETVPAGRDPGGALLRIVFDIRNPRAERWIADKSSTLVREIVDRQKEMVRANLLAGVSAGKNPRTTALDLVGRISPGSKQRTGGVLGLTSGQEEWQRRYEAELASGDPAALRNALTRGLRDKRFDRTVLKAIETGEPIPADIRAKMVTAYRNRSLKFRADTIARTESIRALGASQAEAYDQAIERGQVKESAIKKFWVTAGDERVRHTHRLIPGMNADGRGWREAFDTPTGPSMHAPHDVDIMCRCREVVRINRFVGLE